MSNGEKVAGFTEDQISAAARVLADRSAEACNVDKDDNWKIYGGDFIEDARAAIRALASQPAAPVQPVAWARKWAFEDKFRLLPVTKFKLAEDDVPLYPHPAAPPVQQPGDVHDSLPTDISAQLREFAGNPGYSHGDYADVMRRAADECERFYGGMMAWKKTAQDKDRFIAENYTPNSKIPALATTRPSAALTDEQILALSDENGVTFENSDGGRESPYAEGYDTTENVIAFARAILAASSGAVAVPEGLTIPDWAWSDERTVQLNGIVFGQGYDYTGLESFTQELRTAYGTFLIWPNRDHRGENWSVYFDRDGGMWFEKFANEAAAKQCVAEAIGQLEAEHLARQSSAPATPAQGQTK